MTPVTDSLPPEFRVLPYAPREWTALDSLSLGKLFAESLSVSADVDILRALLPTCCDCKLKNIGGG